MINVTIEIVRSISVTAVIQRRVNVTAEIKGTIGLVWSGLSEGDSTTTYTDGITDE